MTWEAKKLNGARQCNDFYHFDSFERRDECFASLFSVTHNMLYAHGAKSAGRFLFTLVSSKNTFSLDCLYNWNCTKG